ncbi:S1 family peptidase [Corynebacterium sp. HS2168-gen11]|uniref:S1 family peptidase n=1 Tax=Corynebacterium sp. HS2168-gen11 TaxID=2974027 RepID=UPI00216B38E3|nr:S1 family peptidase [Corynebacterium sp. HS2168-gen11]MCS4535572.1 S1 family peptidase [Corynebacterium sp. HS2168-gen11]
MKIQSLMRTLISAVLIGALVPAPVATGQIAKDSPDFVINQGDPIYLLEPVGGGDAKLSTCTVGYVDKANKRLWTAAHCGKDGLGTLYSHFKADGSPYNFNDIEELKQARLFQIGDLHHVYPGRYTFMPSEDPQAQLTSEESQEIKKQRVYDLAYIDISQYPQIAGINQYSGDTTYWPTVGEKVCRYGARTGLIKPLHPTNKVFCGTVIDVNDYFVYTSALGTEQGDSGGPAWVPGKGYIGQVLGFEEFTLQNNVPVTRSSTIIFKQPIDGVPPLYSDTSEFPHPQIDFDQLATPAQEVTFDSSTYGGTGQPPATVTMQPTTTPTTPTSTSTTPVAPTPPQSGSNTSSTAAKILFAVIGIFAGIAVVALPFLQKFLPFNIRG